jgi:hypothetical protein
MYTWGTILLTMKELNKTKKIELSCVEWSVKCWYAIQKTKHTQVNNINCWKWKGKDPSEHKLGKQKKELCLKSSTKDGCSCVNVCEDENTATNVQKQKSRG